LHTITPEALEALKCAISEKYHSYMKSYRTVIWPTVTTICPDKNAFMHGGFSQVNFDIKNLNLAIDEIIQDIVFIKDRRGSLISKDAQGQPLISPGKLAGVITFRLSKRHIVHSDYRCLECKVRCVSKLNTEFALQCGAEFIGVQFETIDPLLQKELFYQLTSRHVNQETLGLIFDTINVFYKKPVGQHKP
jgi:hypothetical protein